MQLQDWRSIMKFFCQLIKTQNILQRSDRINIQAKIFITLISDLKVEKGTELDISYIARHKYCSVLQCSGYQTSHQIFTAQILFISKHSCIQR